MNIKKITKDASLLLAGLMSTAVLSGCTSRYARYAINGHATYHPATKRIVDNTNLENDLPNAKVLGMKNLVNKNNFNLAGYDHYSQGSDNYYTPTDAAAFLGNTVYMQYYHHSSDYLKDYRINNDVQNNDPSLVRYKLTPHTLVLRRNFVKGMPHNTLQMVKYRLHTVKIGKAYKHHNEIGKIYYYKCLILYPYEMERKHTNVKFIPRKLQSQYKLKLTIIGHLKGTNGTLPYE